MFISFETENRRPCMHSFVYYGFPTYFDLRDVCNFKRKITRHKKQSFIPKLTYEHSLIIEILIHLGIYHS